MNEKYIEIWNEIKEEIRLINGNKVEYSKDFMKIKFEPDDNLPIDKILNIQVCVLCKIINVNHKFYYMAVFMSMNISY